MYAVYVCMLCVHVALYMFVVCACLSVGFMLCMFALYACYVCALCVLFMLCHVFVFVYACTVCKDVTLRVHVCFAFIYGMRVCLYVCLYVLHV